MRSLVLLCLVIAGGSFVVSAAEPEKKPAAPDFKREVVPILENKCNRCHMPKQRKGGLDTTTREAMLKGGKTGPAIEPGNADKSLLVELIHFNEMPPKKEQPRVTADELKVLKAWIAAGAPEK